MRVALLRCNMSKLRTADAQVRKDTAATCSPCQMHILLVLLKHSVPFLPEPANGHACVCNYVFICVYTRVDSRCEDCMCVCV